MADTDMTEGSDSTANTDSKATRRRPSGILLLAGLIALGVSIQAFTGPTAWDGSGLKFGWILVVAAIVVGAVLVVSPGRKS